MKFSMLILLYVFLMPSTLRSQTLAQLLQPKIDALDKAEGAKDLQQLANDFERIAVAHPKSWHAHYYAAYCYVRLAYSASKDQIDAFADRADEFLKTAGEIRPEDAENEVLAAYVLGARIYVNPMFRGASMGSESKKLLSKAIERQPDNPRALYVRGMGIYNTPAAFGGGKKKAKPYLDRALALFDAEDELDRLEPHWGLQETQALLANYR